MQSSLLLLLNEMCSYFYVSRLLLWVCSTTNRKRRTPDAFGSLSSTIRVVCYVVRGMMMLQALPSVPFFFFFHTRWWATVPIGSLGPETLVFVAEMDRGRSIVVQSIWPEKKRSVSAPDGKRGINGRMSKSPKKVIVTLTCIDTDTDSEMDFCASPIVMYVTPRTSASPDPSPDVWIEVKRSAASTITTTQQ